MRAFFFSMVCLVALAAWAFPASAFADTRTFEEAAVEINGTVFWLPSTLIVRKGDRVKIRIVSRNPGPESVHGFVIDEFSVQAMAYPKAKEIEFTADKSGIFPIRCHLHPNHVGAQLLVLDQNSP